MKTLIEIDRNVWGRVKHLATVKEITLNSAVELLLVHGLSHRLAHKQRGEQQEQQQQQPSFSANVTKAINQNDGLCGGHSFFNQITKYVCNYCVYDTINVQEYESHVVGKHPGKMCYPGKVDLDRLAVEGQGSPGRNK